MPIPPFILALREDVGHALLWLPGVSAVVSDGEGRLLVTHRADDGTWALPSGIPEPGEQMGQAIAREVAEETGVVVRVDRLVSVLTLPLKTYPNGDRCQFVDHTFAATAIGGSAHVADDESLAVAWVTPSELEALGVSAWQLDVVHRAADTDAPTWFAA